jgi:poly(3-hydroxybutyrate) depolymerase
MPENLAKESDGSTATSSAAIQPATRDPLSRPASRNASRLAAQATARPTTFTPYAVGKSTISFSQKSGTRSTAHNGLEKPASAWPGL